MFELRAIQRISAGGMSKGDADIRADVGPQAPSATVIREPLIS